MALGTRELMLILRARDEAARVLRGAQGDIDNMSEASRKAAQKHIDQGKALVTVGAGIATAGVIAGKWLADSTKAAGDYNTQVAYTKTQTDKVKVSLQELSEIGLDLARTIPVPFEEIQSGLYNIFSSMDVNVPQAKNLLTEFSKAAVAGQTDLGTAAKGTIAILNAWKLPASEVNRVNDVMFRLVQKGVGTYGDFSKAIGRAIPSTVRAGGSIEDLAGMMAFMTRNGLSTAQAATSAGRAFDAMSNPKTEEHMKELGLTTRDANGEFKPMAQIVEELNGKLKNMTAPERAEAMKALFLGSGGTIQARRFFDLAIPGFKELNLRTSEMHNSAGTMEGAYKTMFESPQAQIQLMTNKYQAMRVEVGNELLPIKMKLVEMIMKVLDAWNNLSPETQRFIAITAAVVAGLTVLIGVLTIVVGGILMIMGAAALAGVALGTVIAVVAAVVAAIVALIAVAWLLFDNWEEITQWFSDMWNKMKENVRQSTTDIWNTLQSWGTNTKNFFANLWKTVKDWLVRDWNNMIATFQAIPGRVMGAITPLWNKFTTWWGNLWRTVRNAVVRDWNNMIAMFQAIPGRIMSGINSLWSRMTTFFSNMGTSVRNVVVTRFNSVVDWFRGLPSRIRNAIPSPGSILRNVGGQIMQGLLDGINNMVGSLQRRLSSITNMIPDFKGPANVDRKLLYGAGQLTMQGYGEGIDSGVGAIKDKLQGLTGEVPNMVGVGQAGGAGGVNQNFYITTQEIDPRKHSADLGYLLASKMG